MLYYQGEDETSFQRHNKILIAEKSKSHSNSVLVAKLLDKTFYFRRSDILNNLRDVTAILQKYPFLGIED